jgi:Tfp pilus assembly protein PilE
VDNANNATVLRLVEPSPTITPSADPGDHVQTADPTEPVLDTRERRSRRATRRGRGGFTMIEVLVTIGIIMLLVAIGVIAYRGLDKMASERGTHTAMENATAMLAEFEHNGRLDSFVMADPTNPGNFPSSYWYATRTDPIDTTSGTINLSDVSSSGGSRANATFQGGVVTSRLVRIPKNKSTLGAMPQKSLIEQPKGSPVDTPAFADGWRNPMLFCPAGGIKVFLHADDPTAKTTVLVTAPDHRPFWVSAGPDGDFAKGDDNVYSFSK